MSKYLDSGSVLVTVITLVLFVVPLVVHGVSEFFFLEAGVFLVSAKIIIMAYKNSLATKRLEEKLDAVMDKLARLKESRPA